MGKRGKPIDILAPLAGVNKRFAYQAQPPFTCIDSRNFWARDQLELRDRGGSRPGLNKAFAQLLGSGSKIDLLAQVREIIPSGANYIADEFTNGLSAIWTAASWKSGAPDYAQDGVIGVVGAGADKGVVRAALSPIIDTTKEYTFTLNYRRLLSGTAHQASPNAIELFLRMNDTTPNVLTDGVLVRFSGWADSGNKFQKIEALVYSAGSLVESYGQSAVTWSDGTTVPGMMTVRVNYGGAANQILVTWVVGGDQFSNFYLTIGPTILTAAAGQRFGFGIKQTIGATQGSPWLDSLVLAYTQSGGTTNIRNRLFAVANAIAYEENNASQLVDVSAGCVGATAGAALQGAERLGKLYLPSLTPPTGSIFVYNPTTDTWQGIGSEPGAAGSAPTKCRSVQSWQDRLVVCARSTTDSVDDPHVFYMSKRGTPADWVFFANTVGSALASYNTDLSRIGEPITAGIAHTDDYFIFGCPNSTWILWGDPTLGGILGNLSKQIGVLSVTSWCRGPNGETIILSRDGVYGIAPGGAGYPQALSNVQIPDALRDIDPNLNRVMLAYDVVNEGVHIGITPNDGSVGTYYLFDWRTKGFDPMYFPLTQQPTSMMYYNADIGAQRGVLYGCADGYIRKMQRAVYTDDGVLFDSFVITGPIALSSDGASDGMLVEVIGQTGLGSGPVTLSAMVGNSIEAAAKGTPVVLGTMTAGQGRTYSPRMRGVAAFIKHSSPGGQPWAWEKLSIVRESLGKLRA